VTVTGCDLAHGRQCSRAALVDGTARGAAAPTATGAGIPCLSAVQLNPVSAVGTGLCGLSQSCRQIKNGGSSTALLCASGSCSAVDVAMQLAAGGCSHSSLLLQYKCQMRSVLQWTGHTRHPGGVSAALEPAQLALCPDGLECCNFCVSINIHCL
jgi:hypothetical protein